MEFSKPCLSVVQRKDWGLNGYSDRLKEPLTASCSLFVWVSSARSHLIIFQSHLGQVWLSLSPFSTLSLFWKALFENVFMLSCRYIFHRSLSNSNRTLWAAGRQEVLSRIDSSLTGKRKKWQSRTKCENTQLQTVFLFKKRNSKAAEWLDSVRAMMELVLVKCTLSGFIKTKGKEVWIL